MAMRNSYLVEPFTGSVKSGLRPHEVAGQLESLLNNSSHAQGHLTLLGTVSVRTDPGCLGRMFGSESVWTRHDQVVIGPPPDLSIADSAEGESAAALRVAQEPEHAARRLTVVPFDGPIKSSSVAVTPGSGGEPSQASAGPQRLGEKAIRSWGRLPRNVRIALVAVAALLVVVWIYPSSRRPATVSEAVRAPVAPTPSTSTTARKEPERAQQLRSEAPAPAISQAIDAPRVRVGDRWVTEVIDHQDSRLNYRSERIVEEVRDGRIITSVRTLKNNYRRTIEYDSQWALVASRLPTGATTNFEPALPYFNFPIAPGKTWQARVVETGSTGTQKVHDIRGSISTWETITVPAGTFSALRIVFSDEISENGVLVLKGQDVSWYVPEVRRSVKTEESSFNATSGENRRRTISLLEYSVQ